MRYSIANLDKETTIDNILYGIEDDKDMIVFLFRRNPILDRDESFGYVVYRFSDNLLSVPAPILLTGLIEKGMTQDNLKSVDKFFIDNVTKYSVYKKPETVKDCDEDKNSEDQPLLTRSMTFQYSSLRNRGKKEEDSEDIKTKLIRK